MQLQGELRSCTGCSMVKGHRKPIGSRTITRADKKLGRVSVDLEGPNSTASLTGKRYVTIVNGDFSSFTWLHLLNQKSDAAATLRHS